MTASSEGRWGPLSTALYGREPIVFDGADHAPQRLAVSGPRFLRSFRPRSVPTGARVALPCDSISTPPSSGRSPTPTIRSGRDHPAVPRLIRRAYAYRSDLERRPGGVGPGARERSRARRVDSRRARARDRRRRLGESRSPERARHWHRGRVAAARRLRRRARAGSRCSPAGRG
jgi:hypothetical protein